jgi:hypothetical protein
MRRERYFKKISELYSMVEVARPWGRGTNECIVHPLLCTWEIIGF